MRIYGWLALPLALAVVLVGFLKVPANAQGGATDPVGFFTVKFRGGTTDTKTAFNVGLVNPVEVAGEVLTVNGTKITFGFAFDPSVLPDGGLFTIRDGTTPGLNVDASGLTNPDPNSTEITLTRSVDGLVSVGDSFSLRKHATIAEFFGANNEAGIKIGTSSELADNVAIWDAELQTANVYYWHTTDGWVEAGKEFEGDKSGVPIRFPSGGMFTRRDTSDLAFTRAAYILVPTEQQVFPIKAGVNLVACSLLLSDVSELSFSDYDLYVPGSPLSVNGGTAAPEADVMIYTRMQVSGNPSNPLYYRTDGADGGNWQFVGGGDAGSLAVNGFATLQLFRAGGDGFIRFTGTPTAESSSAARSGLIQVPVTLAFTGTNQYQLIWYGNEGTNYQVQKRGDASAAWKNRGGVIVGEDSEISQTITLEGAGRIRVITQ